jgi:hypothetical protein
MDDALNSLVQEMTNLNAEFAKYSKGVTPFQTQKPTPEEDRMLFENPAALYENEVNQNTGQPYTNAEAAQRMLAEWGPQRYVDWVDSHAGRIQQEHAASDTGEPVVSSQGFSLGAEGGLNDLLQQGGQQ